MCWPIRRGSYFLGPLKVGSVDFVALSHGDRILFTRLTLIIPNAVAYGAIRSMDNDIGLVFSGQPLCFSYSGLLQPVGGSDPLVALAAYGPTLFMGYHILVPGSWSILRTRTLKKDLHQFN